MKAIILSPGPSLARYVRQPADLVCGVNRAAKDFSCDAWVCGDLPLIIGEYPPDQPPLFEQVIGSPLLVSYGVTLDNLRDRKWEWRGETFAWSQLAESSWLHTSVVNWPWCTFTSAIVYAAWRGATEIECYGVDWSGNTDFDGVIAGKNRSEDRWREERGLFNALSVVLGGRGVSVTRKVIA